MCCMVGNYPQPTACRWCLARRGQGWGTGGQETRGPEGAVSTCMLCSLPLGGEQWGSFSLGHDSHIQTLTILAFSTLSNHPHLWFQNFLSSETARYQSAPPSPPPAPGSH